MDASNFKEIINQIFDIEKKITNSEMERSLSRNIRRIKSSLENLGIQYHNPIGEKYNDTRTDCEAMINTDNLQDMKISEVVKPIIYYQEDGQIHLLQRAVVIIT